MNIEPQDLRDLTASMARFARERLIPAEAKTAAENSIPEDIVAEMRSRKLFGMALPREYGGLGLSAAEEVRVVFEFCYAAPVFRGLIGANNGLGGKSIFAFGTSAQKEKYLARVAGGELLLAFGLTEPDAGSDAAALRMRARRRDDGCWVLNGTKRYLSNGRIADLIVVIARTGPEATGPKGVSAFMIEKGTPGVSFGKPDGKMGQHGIVTSDVYFSDCVIASDMMLGQEGDGFRIAMQGLDRSRLHMAAVCAGLADRFIDEAIHFILDRRQDGEPSIEFPLIQAMLADSRAEQLAARALIEDTASRLDQGDSISMEACCCKLHASEMLGRVADRAMQICGEQGYLVGEPIERLYRDSRIFRIFEGTTQIQQVTIAKHMIRQRQQN